MQSNEWAELFRLVPKRHHETLVLMTAVGAEVAVQEIIRVDGPYVVLRGRVSGTNDTDRVFFLPYDRLTYARFQRSVPAEEVYGMYGLTPPEPEKPPEPKPAEPADLAAAEPAPAGAPAGPPAATATPPRGIIRTKLLERIRQRALSAATNKEAPEEERPAD